MKKLCLLVCLLISHSIVWGQDNFCGTGGQFSSSTETAIQTNGSPAGSCAYTIRVFFHIVRRSNGTGGQNSSVIATIVNNLNTAYAPLNIAFQNQGFDEINNDSYYNQDINDDTNFNGLTSTNVASNSINVYLLDDNSGYGGGRSQSIGGKGFVVGGGYTPFDDSRQLIVPSLVTAHEMGHCLGLYHTFSHIYCEELADGSNCTICGDFICDTPAESTSYIFAETNACAFFANFNDPNGNPEHPILSNIMNYVRPSCYQGFTNGQGARMRSAIAMNPTIASAVAFTPMYIGGIYSYGVNTYPIQNSSTGISVSSSANNISIVLPNYGSSTTYTWVVNSRTGNTSYTASGRVANIIPSGGASFNITCNISNSCGSTSVTFNCYNYSLGFRMAAYPNPTSQDMTIAAVKGNDQQNATPQDASMAADAPVQDSDLIDIEANVRLVDKANTIVKEGKLVKGKLNFSVAQIPAGIYYLQMELKDTKIQKQIVIQH